MSVAIGRTLLLTFQRFMLTELMGGAHNVQHFVSVLYYMWMHLIYIDMDGGLVRAFRGDEELKRYVEEWLLGAFVSILWTEYVWFYCSCRLVGCRGQNGNIIYVVYANK